MDIQALDQLVMQWLQHGANRLIAHLDDQLQVNTKSGRSDLVTNLDRETEQFLVGQIKQTFPDDQIFSEEGFGDHVQSLKGRVWFVDPIDGTLNFVKQHDNFAMMVALYEDGQPVYGNILDVRRQRFVHGGPSMGAYLNQFRIAPVTPRPLADGLFGVNGPMFAKNRYHVQDMALASLGTRVLGSAGLEFQQVVLGNSIGYCSYLAPWDVAAGRVLAETVGLKVVVPPENALSMLKRELIVTTNAQALQEVQQIMQGDHNTK
ncbi:inositol monophosphatase family protein [Loigolactobacillus bifermentans]|uniref:Myo-inositol-1(Or 4)-monophosphatase n=1 Tax=Loigolactobacillus bifermentans DSM 20003 TaxID=1423726 RepID=A0A0R1GM40_9LACO|nr:inositol monophosphatase family protein [Loigolactobacillus bifermentans]KRK35135.1 myo-inositol-1(or 4)-monophosphatase [Loigolactobacillus bifermentans DSM 20003]QGG59222.1 inositol monophosphatase family protein [Loigolactobacillus bifermentans]